MFKKILIANRGEIAVRVMRACKEMGITPVAVFSDCDRTALHVAHAEESYHIGPSPSKESYLSMDKIIEVARRSRTDAIHPGYGFLAENADFADACEAAGIVFIGPTPDSIRRMGNKLEARAAATARGVPVIPGSDGPVDSVADARAVAVNLGYPVLIKAAAGGGGKGMRVVANDGDFESAMEMTMGEAESAFGNKQVYIEKYIEKPKHIEIQVLADQHGNTLSIGERECSMQRRYQKVIEEAPSPFVDAEFRAELGSAARSVAEAVGYRSAGTVEFIVGQDGKFYFLEMNTRLQVEHPVTEMVYGVDLVKEQIKVAAGEKVDLGPTELAPRGHAVEARIYAEDPHANFMPSTGLVKRVVLPQGPGVRNENGIYPGYEIPIYYDPLIGKVIVWAENRASAIGRAKRALFEYQVDGVKTNLEFLLWALSEKGFEDGSYDTTYIERHFDASLLHRNIAELDLATIAASITAFNSLKTGVVGAQRQQGGENVWRRTARIEGLRKPRI